MNNNYEIYLEKKKPWIAVVLSLLFGGLGHLYLGKIEKGIIFIVIEIVLWFTIFGGIIFTIYTMIDANNTAKDINFEIDLIEKNKAKEAVEKVEQQKVENLRKENEINADDFISALKKNYKLFSAEIYSADEYRTKKSTIVNELATKQISCSVEDFLGSLISLKDQGILDSEEIKKIKLLVM